MAASDRDLDVYMDGRRAGRLSQSPGGAASFDYDDAYLDGPEATPLSLSLPTTSPRHRGRALVNYLWGLLPDSEPTVRRWAAEHATSANNPVSLLRYVGADAAGAIQVVPRDEPASDADHDAGADPLSDDEFHDLLRQVAAHPHDWDPGRYGGRWSLAGAQTKMALFRDGPDQPWCLPRGATPTTDIIKPVPLGSPFADHHVNEFLCQRAASLAGLRAASITLLDLGDVQAVVSARYDRVRRPDRWHRVHQEDLCQALSIHPSLKYQEGGKGPTMGRIAGLVAGLPWSDREPTATDLVRGLAFNTLIGGTDAHAKNYGLLLRGDRVRLAPLYDLASAACYDQHQRLRNAITISGRRHMLDVRADEWGRLGIRLGIGSNSARTIATDLARRLPDAFTEAVAELPERLRPTGEAMVVRILEHVGGTWRPNLGADPRYVLPAAAADVRNDGEGSPDLVG